MPGKGFTGLRQHRIKSVLFFQGISAFIFWMLDRQRDASAGETQTQPPHVDIGRSLTPPVWLPGVKLSPERNAVKIWALDLPEIPRALRALLQHTYRPYAYIKRCTTNICILNHQKSIKTIFMIRLSLWRGLTDWVVMQQQRIQTYINVAGPEALSLPQTILSTDGWPSTKHRESRASQSHLSTI